VGEISSYPVITEMPPGSVFLVNQNPITASNATSIITKQNVLPLYDARDYGVVADGVTDTTTALNNAFTSVAASGGGTLVFPSGTLVISNVVNLQPSVSILGNGQQGTIINQTSTTHDGLYLSSASVVSAGFTIEGISVVGPGSGSGDGIHIAGQPLAYVNIRNVNVENFGGTGVYVGGSIVTTLEGVVATTNGVHGIWIDGTSSFVTSTSLINCYGNDNPSAGIYIFKATYCSLTGCAADSNGIGYLLSDVFSLSATGCGAESSQSHSVSGYPGVSWKITGDNTFGTGSVCLNGCFSYDTHDIGFWITGFTTGVAMDACIDSTPHGGATYSLQVDSNATASTLACNFANPNNITGAVATLSDSANSYTYLRQLYANGITATDSPTSLSTSQSSLVLTASSGTNFIESVGTDNSGGATLTLGTQFLGVEFASFNGSTGALTVPNAATFSSTVAITGHVTLEGVTSTGATGTGALVFSTSPTLTTPNVAQINNTSNKAAITLEANTSAVNYIDIRPASTGQAVTINAAGSDTDVFLNLTSKGAGTVRANNVQVADISSAQTLTTKTLSGFTIADATNVVLGTTTGTQLGTVGGASGQKLGFWAATPVVQPLLATGASHTVDQVITVLQTLGLVRQT
jgi:hypothetical protein